MTSDTIAQIIICVNLIYPDVMAHTMTHMTQLKYNVFLLVVNELVLLATPIGGQSGPL